AERRGGLGRLLGARHDAKARHRDAVATEPLERVACEQSGPPPSRNRCRVPPDHARLTRMHGAVNPGHWRAVAALAIVAARGVRARGSPQRGSGEAMFEGFAHRRIQSNGVTINLRVGGNGPPLLLLHGNPLTHVSWHKIAPRLAEDFTVVATDLRGYGDSDKPRGTPDHANYSFRTMAEDQVGVMAELGFETFFVTGHDRGARVAHRMALDHPERVRKFA